MKRKILCAVVLLVLLLDCLSPAQARRHAADEAATALYFVVANNKDMREDAATVAFCAALAADLSALYAPLGARVSIAVTDTGERSGYRYLAGALSPAEIYAHMLANAQARYTTQNVSNDLLKALLDTAVAPAAQAAATGERAIIVLLNNSDVRPNNEAARSVSALRDAFGQSDIALYYVALDKSKDGVVEPTDGGSLTEELGVPGIAFAWPGGAADNRQPGEASREAKRYAYLHIDYDSLTHAQAMRTAAAIFCDANRDYVFYEDDLPLTDEAPAPAPTDGGLSFTVDDSLEASPAAPASPESPESPASPPRRVVSGSHPGARDVVACVVADLAAGDSLSLADVLIEGARAQADAQAFGHALLLAFSPAQDAYFTLTSQREAARLPARALYVSKKAAYTLRAATDAAQVRKNVPFTVSGYISGDTPSQYPAAWACSVTVRSADGTAREWPCVVAVTPEGALTCVANDVVINAQGTYAVTLRACCAEAVDTFQLNADAGTYTVQNSAPAPKADGVQPPVVALNAPFLPADAAQITLLQLPSAFCDADGDKLTCTLQSALSQDAAYPVPEGLLAIQAGALTLDTAAALGGEHPPCWDIEATVVADDGDADGVSAPLRLPLRVYDIGQYVARLGDASFALSASVPPNATIEKNAGLRLTVRFTDEPVQSALEDAGLLHAFFDALEVTAWQDGQAAALTPMEGSAGEWTGEIHADNRSGEKVVTVRASLGEGEPLFSAAYAYNVHDEPLALRPGQSGDVSLELMLRGYALSLLGINPAPASARFDLAALLDCEPSDVLTVTLLTEGYRFIPTQEGWEIAALAPPDDTDAQLDPPVRAFTWRCNAGDALPIVFKADAPADFSVALSVSDHDGIPLPGAVNIHCSAYFRDRLITCVIAAAAVAVIALLAIILRLRKPAFTENAAVEIVFRAPKQTDEAVEIVFRAPKQTDAALSATVRLSAWRKQGAPLSTLYFSACLPPVEAQAWQMMKRTRLIQGRDAMRLKTKGKYRKKLLAMNAQTLDKQSGMRLVNNKPLKIVDKNENTITFTPRHAANAKP